MEGFEHADEFRKQHEASNCREHPKYREYDRHRWWRFVEMMLLLVRSSEFAEECHIDLAEHVEGGDSRAQPNHRPDDRMAVNKGLPQDLVLGHESGEWRNAADGERCGEEGDEGDRHVLSQAAHLAHVLLATHRMNDRARSEKQARFEKRVRHQMEN